MRPEDLRRHVGETLILIFYAIVDIVEIWPRSHLFAILSVIFVACLFTLVELWNRYGFILVCVYGIAGAAVYWLSPSILPDETEIHGWLLPGNWPVPKNTCEIPKDTMNFIAGTNVAWVRVGRAKTKVFSIDKTMLLSAELDGDKLAFDADIFDESGNLAVRIIKNEFHLIQGKYSYRDRTEDRTELIVYDNKGSEMLHVIYANTSTVFISGVFFAANGKKAIIDYEKILVPGKPPLSFARNCFAGGLSITYRGSMPMMP